MSTIMTFNNQIFSILLIVTIAIFSTSKSLVVIAKNVGITTDLVHRDSPKSPFYDSSLTPSQRVANALRRSVKWFSIFKSGSTDIIVTDHAEFLMRISIGTPRVDMLAVIDSGSDLTWIQCEPCTNCFKQKAPVFSPNKSSTYRAVPCSFSICQSLLDTSCNYTTNTCKYSVWYGDNSFTHGDLATETVTLVSTEIELRFPDTIIGCGHNNDIHAYSDLGTGIVGLGGGPGSLISQASSSIGGKFSYCLVPLNSKKSGKLYVGERDTFPSTDGAVSTPLFPNHPVTYYHVKLIGISVGSERIIVPDPPPRGTELPREGNMIIDAGTTLTRLPPYLYNQFEAAVKKYVKLRPRKDPGGILSLCYDTIIESYFPIITLHFEGADVKLNPSNTFIHVVGVTMCLAFASDDHEPAILGNVAQANLYVSYDLQKKLVSFKPTDCEKV